MTPMGREQHIKGLNRWYAVRNAECGRLQHFNARSADSTPR